MNAKQKIYLSIILPVFVFVFVFLFGGTALLSPKKASAWAVCSLSSYPTISVNINGYGSFSGNNSITVDSGTSLSFTVHTYANGGSNNSVAYSGAGRTDYTTPSPTGRSYSISNITGTSFIDVWLTQYCDAGEQPPDASVYITINVNAVVNGGWSAWGACSASSCGVSGTQTRTCDNPTRSGGGADCVGSSSQSCTGACTGRAKCANNSGAGSCYWEPNESGSNQCNIHADCNVPSGTVTAGNCSVGADSSSCSSSISWSTSNPLPNISSSVTTPTNITVGSGNSSSTTYSVSLSTRTFYLYHNGALLSQATATASCAGGTSNYSGVCRAQVNCVGAWGACSNGTQTYTISTPAAYGGTACAYANGATQACGTAGVCAVAHYNCTTPVTSTSNASNATTWNWVCPGPGGGTNASCSENKSVPVVTTAGSFSNITTTTATGGGTTVSDGGATVTVSGLVWSTTINPTTVNSKTTDGWAIGGPWTSGMTSLAPATLYHVRAYATNAVGTSYGADVTFTTGAVTGVATVVTSSPVTNIAQTTASGAGTISSNGGSTVTVSGCTWSTTVNPTYAGGGAVSGSTGQTTNGWASSGPWPCSITGLSAGTLYHVRAFAVNGVGTSYGSDVSFTTVVAAGVPTVSTVTPVTSITMSTASGGGTTVSNGGTAVTVSGCAWSTSANPIYAGGGAISGSTGQTTNGWASGGPWPCSITGITASTLYHVRAFAVNAVGTSYGADISFTTTGPAVIGGWSDWSACSATECGTSGTQTRTCTNPAPANSGADCVGALSQACSAPGGVIVTATPATITVGAPVTVTWTSCAQSCTGQNFNTGGAPSGSLVVYPTATTTFIATCDNYTLQ